MVRQAHHDLQAHHNLQAHNDLQAHHGSTSSPWRTNEMPLNPDKFSSHSELVEEWLVEEWLVEE